MTPECCLNCKRLNPYTGACNKFRACASWWQWFSFEWVNIRRAATNIKEKERSQDNDRTRTSEG